MVSNSRRFNVIFAAAVLFLILIFKIEKTNPDISSLQEEVNETAMHQETASLGALNYQVFKVVISEAPAFLAAYLDNGAEILSKNHKLHWPLASITKLMTALVIRESLDLGQSVKIDEAAILEEGAAGGFSAGEVFSVSDLLKAMLAVSSNDIAAALSGAYLQIKNISLIEAMNQKAETLQMNNTRFVDATGLSVLNQSTAEDLIRLMRYLFESRPEILGITRQKEVEITELNSKIKRELRNINKFAGDPDFIGGKTGFTDEANGNLISLFDPPNSPRLVFIAVFGAEDRFAETEKIYNAIK